MSIRMSAKDLRRGRKKESFGSRKFGVLNARREDAEPIYPARWNKEYARGCVVKVLESSPGNGTALAGSCSEGSGLSAPRSHLRKGLL